MLGANPACNRRAVASGGYTPNLTYSQICSGQTSHAEVMRIVFDLQIINYK